MGLFLTTIRVDERGRLVMRIDGKPWMTSAPRGWSLTKKQARDYRRERCRRCPPKRTRKAKP